MRTSAFFRLGSAFAAALMLGACAHPIMANLRPASSSGAIYLETTHFQDNKPRGQDYASYALGPGAYVAEKENDLGVFYRGPGITVAVRRPSGNFVANEGGIWLPKKTGGAPYYYIYTHKKQVEGPDPVQLFGKADATPAQKQDTTTTLVTIGMNAGQFAVPGAGVGTGAVAGGLVAAVFDSLDDDPDAMLGFVLPDDPVLAAKISASLASTLK